MAKMFNKLFYNFLRDEDGAGVVEYIIVLAVVALIVVMAFPTLQKMVKGWFGGSMNNISNGLGSNNT